MCSFRGNVFAMQGILYIKMPVRLTRQFLDIFLKKAKNSMFFLNWKNSKIQMADSEKESNLIFGLQTLLLLPLQKLLNIFTLQMPIYRSD